MCDFRVKDKDTIREIRKIKQGSCPHMFITGISVSAMESLALRVAETVKEERLLYYKGIVKSFTINMPYFDNEEKVEKFIFRIKDSVSIAKDCYAKYCGSVLVEMSEEWSKKGYNSTLEIFIDYIQENENLHFVIILPKTREESKHELIFSEFTRSGIWLKINSETPTPHQCLRYFKKVANSHGYSVSNEAEMVLLENLKARDEFKIENIKIVEQLIKQIIFNRTFEKNKNKVIDTDDIVFISGLEKKKNAEIERRIGFMSYNR